MTTGSSRQFPGNLPGTSIGNVPGELRTLYEEARESAGAGAYTGAVMLCRKMLMNIAVKEGLVFVQYIKYLEDNHYFSPKSKDFVVYIKNLGNEANHEIAPKTQADAQAAIEFVRALLSHNYELPSRVPAKAKRSTT